MTVTNVCHDAISSPDTLGFALQKIENVPVPTASRENVLKAFRLFYRSAPAPHEKLVRSLQVMLPGAKTVEADWAAVLYTVCVSSGWQSI